MPGAADRLVHTRYDVKIDRLSAGRVLRPGCEVPFPEPKEVSAEPRLISLPDFVSLKLDSYRVRRPPAQAKTRHDQSVTRSGRIRAY